MAIFSGVPVAMIFSAVFAPFGSEIDDPVGRFDQIHVVLDHQHCIAAVDEFLQHADQFVDVMEMESCCRLIENVDGLAGRGARRVLWPV